MLSGIPRKTAKNHRQPGFLEQKFREQYRRREYHQKCKRAIPSTVAQHGEKKRVRKKHDERAYHAPHEMRPAVKFVCVQRLRQYEFQYELKRFVKLELRHVDN